MERASRLPPLTNSPTSTHKRLGPPRCDSRSRSVGMSTGKQALSATPTDSLANGIRRLGDVYPVRRDRARAGITLNHPPAVDCLARGLLRTRRGWLVWWCSGIASAENAVGERGRTGRSVPRFLKAFLSSAHERSVSGSRITAGPTGPSSKLAGVSGATGGGNTVGGDIGCVTAPAGKPIKLPC
jgi:hypothetical protein